jgi:hypothetical protein
MLIVLATKLASIRNAEILVPEVVERTLNVEWSVIRQFAFACLDILETHSHSVRLFRANQFAKYPPHVIQVLVVQMHSVASKMELEHVLAILIMLEILMRAADLNAFSTPTVLPTKLVSETNARTLAQELVDKMQIAKL